MTRVLATFLSFQIHFICCDICYTFNHDSGHTLNLVITIASLKIIFCPFARYIGPTFRITTPFAFTYTFQNRLFTKQIFPVVS